MLKTWYEYIIYFFDLLFFLISFAGPIPAPIATTAGSIPAPRTPTAAQMSDSHVDSEEDIEWATIVFGGADYVLDTCINIALFIYLCNDYIYYL
jgi:hypothetical protein